MVRDGSIGPAGAGPVGPGLGDVTYDISEDLGERAGTNLYHSFSEFGVALGETASFSASLPTDHVLARVTGGNESQVFGTVQSTIPGAALWLVNPAGW